MDRTGRADVKSLDYNFNSEMNIVDIRIQYFKEQFTANNNHNNSMYRIQNNLMELAKEFVSNDRAASYIIIVCRKFYIKVALFNVNTAVSQNSPVMGKYSL